MPDQRRLEPARARLVGRRLAVAACLGDRVFGAGRGLDQIVAEEAAALMRPQPRVQAVAREETALAPFQRGGAGAPVTIRYGCVALRKVLA